MIDSFLLSSDGEEGNRPQSTALHTTVNKINVDGMVQAWLSSLRLRNGQQDENNNLTGSLKTMTAYEGTMKEFREALRHKGLDLDSAIVEESDHAHIDQLAEIALFAQEFASWSKRNRAVSNATYNQRLAILSSFYAYTMRQRWLKYNPIASVTRAKVQPYKGIKALNRDDIAEALKNINRSIPSGARDYALIAILLQTGRRVSEVATLQWKHVTIDRKSHLVTLDFEHCKGGKQMEDLLPLPTSNELLSWLRLFYGKDLRHLNEDAPLWVNLARNKEFYGSSLSIQAIGEICEKHLGTSKVHRTRHTWAKTMEEAGAKVSVIQSRLGHSSLATTGRYLAALNQAENEYADTIAAMFGIGQ